MAIETKPMHTPEPWMICRTRTDGGAPIIVGRRGRDGMEREVAKALFHNGSEDPEVHANARRIVHAVNNFDALYGALMQARNQVVALALYTLPADQAEAQVAYIDAALTSARPEE
jgi:hypothetical protein